MPDLNRRSFLLSGALAAALGGLPASIARALDIPAARRTGTLMDVEHVVILTQENRSFDHYFGSLRGVRGFSDRFPIPTRHGSVWSQPDETDPKRFIAPFHLNTAQTFAHMRAEGTPHTFPDAQAAWDGGMMDNWTAAKHNHSLGYYTREDIPFQYALAEAFTLCDAYHCALHAGTDPNRLFIWTGTNDPLGLHNGPVITNQYDTLDADPEGHGGYTWTTYPERLTGAGISWQIYQNMADNFSDNPLAGFKLYRTAYTAKTGALAELARRALSTRDLDKLKEDVLADRLPQVSWIVATEEGSEHPGPSSPAQGADYTSKVLDALTANPEVWAKTVFLINFDENDGYFDHVPPPAPPSRTKYPDPTREDVVYGESQIDTVGEYHTADSKSRPYGLGPRVPLYVISPWSKGGFVNSQVFDHTSVIRFLEARFGVHEPNISAWRRAVCGDLTSCFDFANPDGQAFFQSLPDTRATADRARALPGRVIPPTPAGFSPPVQENGQRPARPLPYDVTAIVRKKADDADLEVELINNSAVATVFHIYPISHYALRYTVKPNSRLKASVTCEDGMAWFTLLGPNGFTRVCQGSQSNLPLIQLEGLTLTITNTTDKPTEYLLKDEAYGQPPKAIVLAASESKSIAMDFSASHNWYDFSLNAEWVMCRLAGHIEDGKPSMSDPALGGPAVVTLPADAKTGI